jgi:hypothetical protein
VNFRGLRIFCRFQDAISLKNKSRRFGVRAAPNLCTTGNLLKKIAPTFKNIRARRALYCFFPYMEFGRTPSDSEVPDDSRSILVGNH